MVIRVTMDSLYGISEGCYLQKTDIFPDKADVQPSFNFRIGSRQIADSPDSDIEYGQTETLDLTIGGNFPIKTEDDRKNPNSDFGAHIYPHDPDGWKTLPFL